MLKNDDRITSLQAFILIVSTINAIEVLILPRDLGQSVGPDGWAALIGGHLLSAVGVFFIIKLGLLYPEDTFVEYAQKIAGRFLGIFLAIFAGSMWVVICARIVRQFADFIQLILPQTPIETVILTMLLVAAYLARHGIEPIARTVEILFPIFTGILGFLVLASLTEFDYSNLLPILDSSPKDLALESIKTSLGLEGQAILLMLLPFLAIPQNGYKVMYGALAFNLGLRLSLFVTTIGFFGVELAKILVWPVEELSRSLGVAFGRLDSVFTALWVTVAFTSILMYYYLSSLTFSRILKFREQSIMLLPLAAVIFVIALIPESLVAVEELSDIVSWFWGPFILTVPPLLLLVSYIRGTHKKKNEKRMVQR